MDIFLHYGIWRNEENLYCGKVHNRIFFGEKWWRYGWCGDWLITLAEVLWGYSLQGSTKTAQFTCTEGSRLMRISLVQISLVRISLVRISLVRISLLQFYKTFHKHLAYAFLGLFISLLRFLYLANAILLLRLFG